MYIWGMDNKEIVSTTQKPSEHPGNGIEAIIPENGNNGADITKSDIVAQICESEKHFEILPNPDIEVGRPKEYTKNVCLNILQDFTSWLMAADKNCYKYKFLKMFNLPIDIFHRIERDYASLPAFQEATKIINTLVAEKKLDLASNFHRSAPITIFDLKNNHGYTDKIESKTQIEANIRITRSESINSAWNDRLKRDIEDVTDSSTVE